MQLSYEDQLRQLVSRYKKEQTKQEEIQDKNIQAQNASLMLGQNEQQVNTPQQSFSSSTGEPLNDDFSAVDNKYAEIVQQEQSNRQSLASRIRDLTGFEASPEALRILAPSDTQDKIENYKTKYSSIYGDSNTDYDKEYQDYQNNPDRTKNYGNLTRKWASLGGATKIDKYGNEVLDITAQNEAGKKDKNTMSASEIFDTILNRTEESDDFEGLYNELNDKNVKINKYINKNDLTPEERRELNKHKELLLAYGVASREGPVEERNQKGYKMIARGVTDTINSAVSAIGSLIKNTGISQSIDTDIYEGENKAEAIQTAQEASANTDPGFTKAYDKTFKTFAPQTGRDKVLAGIGSFLVPFGGTAKGANITKTIAKTLVEATGASVTTEAVDALDDYLTLTKEERDAGIQQKAPLKKGLLTLVSGLGGLAISSKLSNITKEELKAIKNKISKNEKLDVEQAKQLQELVKDGGTLLEKKIYDDLRGEVVTDLEKQIYKTHTILNTNTKSVNTMSSENISKIEKAFNNVTNSRNNEILDEILSGAENINIDKTEISHLLTKSKKVEKEINKFTDSFSSSTGDKNIGELKSAIKEETLTKARQNIRNKVEEAGAQYENALSGVKDQKIKIGAIDVKKDMNEKMLNETDTKLLNYYGDKFNKAEKVEDLIKIQREINEDLYRADDSTKYLLNDIKSKINTYYTTEAKNGNKAFQKIIEANEQYSKNKAIIDSDRDILDKLHGGSDKFKKAENRTLEESSTAYEKYNTLSPEQQARLLELSDNNEVFRNINRSNIKKDKFDTYSDLELRNAYGDKSEEAITLARSYGSDLPANELAQQVTTAFINSTKTKQILADDYKKIMNNISSQIKDKSKAEQLNNFTDSIIKEKQAFQQAKMFSDLKTGNAELIAKKVKTPDDVDNLYNIKNILSNKTGSNIDKNDIATLNSYINDVIEIKKKDFVNAFENITQNISETENINTSVDKITKYLEDTKELASKLYNNRNISQNLDTLNQSLPKIKQTIQELKDKAKELKESNDTYKKYSEFVNKTNNNTNTDNTVAQTVLYSILSGNITKGIYTTIGNMFLKSFAKYLTNRRLRKLSEDPHFFAKKFKVFKQEAHKMANLENSLNIDLMRNLNKYYGNLISNTINTGE